MKTFLRNLACQSGNVTVMFALGATLVLGSAGVAVDFSRKMAYETKLQAAVDGAALAAASADESKRKATAQDFFNANFIESDDVKIKSLTTSVKGDSIIVQAEAEIHTSIMGLMGINTMKGKALGASSIADRNIEVALVLDVSGSMNAPMSGTRRINVLKTAAQNLVDILSDKGSDMSKVKIAVIPFNMNVNVGTSANFVKDTRNALFTGQAWAGCVLERSGSAATDDSYTNDNGLKGKWQAYIWPPEPNSANNCINMSNGTNTGYAVLDPPSGYAVSRRGPNYNCVRHPIMPLSNKYSEVSAKIASLTAEGNMGTIIAPGVSWGMRVLSPSAPFTEGQPVSSKVLKYMVVLTDGEQTTEAEYFWNKCGGARNTVSAYSFNPATLGLAGKALSTAPRDMFSSYGYILDSDPFGTAPKNWTDVRKDLFNISTSACAKAKGTAKSGETRVFTIAVSNDAGKGTTTYDLLNNCASGSGDFYLATDANALKGAFEAIANEIKEIRLVQ